MELFMAGGSYPVAEVPFPKEIYDAVQTEMSAANLPASMASLRLSSRTS
jgi:hypothetical protein